MNIAPAFKTLFGLLIVMSIGCQNTPTRLTEYVNPFIGTGGHGHTYPGASAPFGMVQLSPDTRLEGWDGCSGYHYSDSVIYGFSHTHLSGTGISDYGDILLMPTLGEVQFDNGYKSGVDNGYASRFSHENESASPGYYQALLKDYDINAELTVSARAGLHKYTYEKEGQSNVILDLEHRDELLDVKLEILDDRTVRGKRVSKAWASKQIVYFYLQFSKPFVENKIYARVLNGDNRATKAAFTFDIVKGEELLVKVGISAVDEKGAQSNVESEIPDWDFELVKNNVTKEWQKQLHKIEVEGGTKDEKTIFYTALYHSMLNPNLFTDVDGRYRGMDLKIHETKEHDHYTVFSLWDTFRASHPLFTLIEQERTNDFINTFLAQYNQGEILPIWELAGNYTGCMIGYHSIPVIADAYAKGINGYDSQLALKAMITSARQDHLGLDAVKKQGYIPADHESESVSKTLEYAYDDWCIANMAKSLNDTTTYNEFIQRGQYYKNIYDPSIGFMRAKVNGSWFTPFDPSEVNYNYTEANSWQYSMFVPQDILGMIALYGGKEKFEQKLDELFETTSDLEGRHQADITGLIGQYAHGNEPSHHMAYLYNYIDKPWKTQQRVNQITNTMYSNKPDGLSGNEDCGQMSAWYVMSAMGFYSVTPGLPYYTLGTPKFDKVKINLENGKTFEIIANNNGQENYYVQSTNLEGKAYTRSYINHEDIMKGGKMTLELGNKANQTWFEVAPKSTIDERKIVPVPYIESTSRTFIESHTIALGKVAPELKIFYNLNDSINEPSILYNGAMVLNESTIVRAMSVDESGEKSFIVRGDFLKIKGDRSIDLKAKYSNQYAAGGTDALINYLRGGTNYLTGLWQGYEGQDLIATVDLGKSQYVNKVSMGFLQNIKAWIWYPPQVQFEASRDGENFYLVATIENKFSNEDYGSFIQDFSTKVGKNVRYIRVSAANQGVCPKWHPGSGGETWIFADEIVID